MKYKNIIRGENCSLIRLKKDDGKAVELFYSLFNEEEIAIYLNQEYIKHKTKFQIGKWIAKKVESKVDVWYLVKWKTNYIGYICFKWREHYGEACEVSTSIERNYRGLKLGYESSKILIDYILTLNQFKYIVAYFFTGNIRAEKNLRKIGFRKATRLNKTVTREFYGGGESDNEDKNYTLMAIYT